MTDAAVVRALLERSWRDRRISALERQELLALGVDPAGLRAAVVSFAQAVAAADPTAAGAVVAWAADALSLGSGGGARTSEVWFAPHEDVCGHIIRAFDEARATADVCVFTVTDDRIASALIAAHKRGVKVRLASDDLKSGDLGSDIDRIARAGVAVRIDRTDAHMHHKFAIFDGELLLNGSYNWTRSANAENQENCVLTDDAKLVAAFGREFERVWTASATW